MKDLSSLYFYKGKYRTDEGLKRVLIKEGIVWKSPKRNYYCWEKYWEYCYDFDYIRDLCWDNELITEDEYNHFQKWLNKMIKLGEITVCNTSWYHCDENDGVGTREWWETREAVIDAVDRYDNKYPDDFIENAEYSIEEYCQTLSEEQFNIFEKLPEEKQYRLAMKWRIDLYNKDIKQNEEVNR